jgi:hypothetical protein
VRTMAHPFDASGSSLSVAPYGTRFRYGPSLAMDLVVAVGMEKYPVAPAVCAPERSPDDVMVVPSCHLGDRGLTDWTAPVLFFPQLEQALPAVELFCEFGAEALLEVQFPRRIVGIRILCDFHVALEPQLCGVE